MNSSSTSNTAYLSKIHNRPLIVCSQYGDESIALIQWAYELGLKSLEIVSIETGWAAEHWKARLELGEAHARSLGFKTRRIVSAISFADAVKGRGEFPSAQFQWCSALLKGLPLLDWLDTWDPACQAIIVLAKRRASAKAEANLPEWLESCEFHQGRTVWHPLLNHSNAERDALLQRAGFKPLEHRTLECDPCVNSTLSDLARLGEGDIQKVQDLETLLGSAMFSNLSEFPNAMDSSGALEQGPMGIQQLVKWAKQYNNALLDKHYRDLFYRGCGNHFGCGL